MNTKEKNWRDGILKDFAPNVSRLTLVSDQDQLLVEEVLSLNLQNQGFEIMEFQDAFEFRYAYESKYRKIWDDGKQTDLIVILRVDNEDLNFLPYDLLVKPHVLEIPNSGQSIPSPDSALQEHLPLLHQLYIPLLARLACQEFELWLEKMIPRHTGDLSRPTFRQNTGSFPNKSCRE